MSEFSSFSAKLEAQQDRTNSPLMVGLDSQLARLPQIYLDEELPQLAFNRMVIEATKDVCCCYKVQMAFYEEQGLEGYQALQKTLELIPDHIPVVADGKRNDIGNTCRAYAEAFYHKLGFDAVTLNPYLGFESVEPFLYPLEEGVDGKTANPYQNKAIFVLAKTSNPGSGDIQNLQLQQEACKAEPVYLHLARLFVKRHQELARRLQKENGVRPAEMGFVAGATYPEELKAIREAVGEETILLIPGIGAQGGDVEKTMKYGSNAQGQGVLINSSRGIIFPNPANKTEQDEDVIARRVREAAVTLRDELNRWR
jgi:orotidine-5'-phosphate decarboxylase